MTVHLTNRELLARLVSFDSTSSRSNLPIADFIADYLDDEGVTIQRQSSAAAKTNLLVTIGPPADKSGQGLILSGHMDCVPAREPEWTSNPFRLVDSGDRLVGRGTADMKGFLAVAINAAARVDASKLRAPLVLLLTYDEELGTIGAQHFTEAWSGAPLPRNAVIGEPTSLRAVRMHKGHLKLSIVTRGRPAHSGYPHLGENAIEKMAKVVTALEHLGGELRAERSEESAAFAEVPFVPLNVGVIHGGTAVNIVPDRCEIEAGVRLLPGMQSEPMIDRISKSITNAGMRDAAISVASDSPPLRLDANADIHRRLCTMLGQSEQATVGYATDAGWFQRLGIYCVVFGPGSIEVAHRPNEFIPKAELVRAAEIVEKLIDEYCR